MLKLVSSTVTIASICAICAVGCRAESLPETLDDDATQGLADASCIGDKSNKRIRNAPTSQCLQRLTSLPTATTSSCSNANPFLRWNIVVEAPGLHSIRLAPDPSLCLSLLTFEPGDVPFVGPCFEDDLGAAGQLFLISPAGPHEFLISDPAGEVYMTSLQPSGVVMLPLGDPNLALQRWRIY